MDRLRANTLALIVDDEPDICELLEITLSRLQIGSRRAMSLAQAHELLKRYTFELCLTDLRLPDGDGIALVAHIQKTSPRTPVAVITAHGSMETAIQALKAGAFDFITKPIDLGGLRVVVGQALRVSERRPEAETRLIGDSEAMRVIRATITKLARSQAPVYISGESGTGKELVARSIHDQGPRSGQPFVPVNCGAIPQDLLESEFFGHRKGSFTGAVADQPGLFQTAHGGTLFLDEVAELPISMQVKLLRAIQERCVRPIGAQHEVPVDVRILSATHKDLAPLATDGRFRQDLYYRINVIELHVPPLRARPEDIPDLVEMVLQRLTQHGRTAVLSDRAQEALLAYPFPGNVRELENVLERALTLCEGEVIEPLDLDLKRLPVREGAERPDDANLDHYLDGLERQRITGALTKTRGNKTGASRLLGITLRALRYRLEKLGMED
ncbi:MAG: sigma-54-dependent Fis family transcriptional regulator [Gammaproteobacteria bacterium]|nr:sigma-54-dependent Fis family transcriptional regulator [Gammaproteobacteria bacterium]